LSILRRCCRRIWLAATRRQRRVSSPAKGKLLGLIAIADPIKESTPQALAALRAAGIPHRMATRRPGDRPRGRTAIEDRRDLGEFARGTSRAGRSLKGARPAGCDGRDGVNDAPGARSGRCRHLDGHRTTCQASSHGNARQRHLRGIVCARELSTATVAEHETELAFAFPLQRHRDPIAQAFCIRHSGSCSHR